MPWVPRQSLQQQWKMQGNYDFCCFRKSKRFALLPLFIGCLTSRVMVLAKVMVRVLVMLAIEEQCVMHVQMVSTKLTQMKRFSCALLAINLVKARARKQDPKVCIIWSFHFLYAFSCTLSTSK